MPVGTSVPADLSLPVWGAWIETDWPLSDVDSKMSLPVWGAWIETAMGTDGVILFVAPRVGGVD